MFTAFKYHPEDSSPKGSILMVYEYHFRSAQQHYIAYNNIMNKCLPGSINKLNNYCVGFMPEKLEQKCKYRQSISITFSQV